MPIYLQWKIATRWVTYFLKPAFISGIGSFVALTRAAAFHFCREKLLLSWVLCKGLVYYRKERYIHKDRKVEHVLWRYRCKRFIIGIE